MRSFISGHFWNFSQNIYPCPFTDTLQKRQKTNVITLFGQCLSFTLEIIVSIISHFAILVNFSTVDIRIFTTALLTASYFVASPELKRFYFKE